MHYYKYTRTNWVIAQLPADYWSICIVPSIITDSAPGIVDADLHPALSYEIAIEESHSTISAGYIGQSSSWKIFKEY